jgi:hypothetical protein
VCVQLEKVHDLMEINPKEYYENLIKNFEKVMVNWNALVPIKISFWNLAGYTERSKRLLPLDCNWIAFDNENGVAILKRVSNTLFSFGCRLPSKSSTSHSWMLAICRRCTAKWKSWSDWTIHTLSSCIR